MDVQASDQPKMMSISAVVHRADGTEEDLGVISYWHQNPVKRLAFKVGQWIKTRRANA